MFAALLALLTGGCASEVGSARPSSMPAQRSNQVSSTVSVDIAAPIAEVFDYVVREDTPERDLRSYGPIGGVRGGVRLTDGGWDHSGARRVVVLDGGSTLVEEIELIERPHRFGYHVKDFSFIVKDVATEGRGYWEFEPMKDGGTRVSWTYTFTARSCPAQTPLRAAMSAFFHPYMAHGMASIKKHIEESHQTAQASLQ